MQGTEIMIPTLNEYLHRSSISEALSLTVQDETVRDDLSRSAMIKPKLKTLVLPFIIK